MTVCPVDAIVRDETTGAVVIDEGKCTGCGICSEYCFLGVIRVEAEKRKAVKCDLCGGDPVCVKECPAGALELVQVGSEDKR